MNKNFIKTKIFFIKSFLLMIFLALATVVISNLFFEQGAYNFMVKNFTANSASASDDIVIITIDDKSLSYQRWPWPRDYYGKMIAYLRDYSKPKVIGFDTLIQNLDKDNADADRKFFGEVKKTDNLVLGFSALETGAFSSERNELYNKKFNDKFKIDISIPDGFSLPESRFEGLSEFPDDYFNVLKNIGSVNHEVSSDGYIISIPQLIGVHTNYYPSLSLKMFLIANSKNQLYIGKDLITSDGTNLTLPTIYYPTVGFVSDLRYYALKDNSEYSHKTYSASDIIKSYENIKNGTKPIINPKEFENKFVFIGANSSAQGIGLDDSSKTPLLEKHPGVDIQATSLDNIIRNDYMRRCPNKYQFIILSLIAIITFILICKYSFITSLVSCIVISICYIIFASICYYNVVAVPVITPILLQAATSIFGYSYRFIREGRDKEKIQQAMGKYLSQDIMKNVVKNIDDIKLGGKRAFLTVLFADIRGFTSMSEKMPAEEVSKILNEYFTEIEPIITKYNGVINKFIGDAVMAIFGEPIQDLNHPVNAVKCAYAILKKVEALQDKWLFEGKPKIEIGIGINTGEAFVGNIGSEKRLEYTVIGDTVNLASRIESYNKIYHTNLLVSTSTYSYISDIANVIKISDVTIRGKSRKMDIYEVLKLNEK